MVLRGVALIALLLGCAPKPRVVQKPTGLQDRVVFVPQVGHAQPIRLLAVSRDGRIAASVDSSSSPGRAGWSSDAARGIVKFWDVASGAVIGNWHWNDGWTRPKPRAWEFPSPGESSNDAQGVHAIALSPDGRLAVVATTRLRLVEVATGRVLGTYFAKRRRNMGFMTVDWNAVAFSPDGRRVIAGHGSGSGRLEILDVQRWTVERTLADPSTSPDNAVTAVAFSPDGTRVAAAGTNKQGRTVQIWNPATGSREKHLPTGGSSLRFSSDGRQLAVAGGAGVEIWDVTTGARLGAHPLGKHTSLAFTGELVRTQLGATTAAEIVSPTRAVVTDGNSLRLVDASGDRSATGAVIHSFRPGARPLVAAAVSADARRAISSEVGSSGAVVRIWNLETLALERTLAGFGPPLAMSPDGAHAIAGVSDGVVLLDTKTGRVVRNLPITGGLGEHAQSRFLPDGNHVVVVSNVGAVALWNTATGGSHIDSLGVYPQRVVLSRSGFRALLPATSNPTSFRAVASGITNDRGEVWDLQTRKRISGGAFGGRYLLELSAAALLVDRHVIVAVGDTVDAYEIETGRLVRTMEVPSRAPSRIAISSDGQRALLTSLAGSITLWSLQDAAVIRTLDPHSGPITMLEFVAGDRYAVSASDDGSMRLHRLDTGTSVAMVAIGDHWAVYSSDGYFDASRRGGELVAAVKDLQPFAIDQLAIRNNRPDVLLDRIGLGTRDAIAHFRSRYDKRLKSLRLDERHLTTQFDRAPEARIVSLVRDGKFVDLEIQLSDREALARYNLYVNDVPMHGGLGAEVSGTDQTLRERVELGAGLNRIEVTALNRAGSESLRDAKQVVLEATRGDLYYIGLGVSKYRDPRLDLKYAHKDATDLAAAFGAGKTAFTNYHAKTFTDTEVTVATIRAAKDLLRDAKVDDTVVVFVAGHGMHARDATADYFFVTHESDPERLAETAASFGLLEDLLQNIPPRRKLLLLDTCESGELDEEEAITAPATNGGLRSRGLVRVQGPGGRVRSAAARRFLFDRERYIYNDLARRSGSIVLSSSRGSEVSYEGDEWQNGVFTHMLVRALSSAAADADRSGSVTIDELRAYLSNEVPKLTDDRQHPTIDRDNLRMKMEFAVPLASP